MRTLEDHFDEITKDQRRRKLKSLCEDLASAKEDLADVIRMGVYEIDRQWVEDRFDAALKAENGNMSMTLKGEVLFVCHPSELLSDMKGERYDKEVRRFADAHLKIEDCPSYIDAKRNIEKVRMDVISFCTHSELEVPVEVG